MKCCSFLLKTQITSKQFLKVKSVLFGNKISAVEICVIFNKANKFLVLPTTIKKSEEFNNKA